MLVGARALPCCATFLEHLSIALRNDVHNGVRHPALKHHSLVVDSRFKHFVFCILHSAFRTLHLGCAATSTGHLD